MILKKFESFKSSEVEKILVSAEEFLLNKKHWKDERGEWHITGKLDVPKEWIYKGKFIIPIYEIDSIDLEGCELTTLEGCPKFVYKSFSCIGNKLTDLKGSPNKVQFFYASQNNLTSLEGAPEYVGYFYFHINPNLSSLEGAPKILNNTFVPVNDRTLVSDIEAIFYDKKRGYWSNYYLELLQFILDRKDKNHEELIKSVKGWPEGFLSDNLIQSVKTLNKFKI